jgi:hypothetical protein
MKAMDKLEQQEDVAVKEREDGTALAALDDKPDPFEADDKEEAETKAEAEDNAAEEQDSEQDSDESEEDREALREARREERKLKKELVKQREASAKHKISALERRNEEMARRLAQLESAATGFQFAQLDRYIEDEATRVEYAKMKMTQAAKAGNAVEQAEFMEQFHEAKNKLAQAQLYRQRQLEEVNKPRSNVPSPMTEAVKENASTWLNRNTWYDPNGQDTDSKIAKVIDNSLASEGWDPADPEYWEELDNRLKERLPHRYTGKSGARNRRTGTPSGRSDVSGSPAAKNTFTLSRERVQALKDAGMWDDPAKRAKAIRRYADFDRTNRG